MKVAGRRNDGAWYRMNRVIKGLSENEKENLGIALFAMDSASDAYAVVTAFADAAGYSAGDPGIPVDAENWLDNFAQTGIPRQAWFGVLSYDTYTRSGEEGGFTYTPEHAAAWRAFGIELRDTCKRFVFARRQALDLSNIAVRDDGNPGGLADATESN